MRDPKLKTRDEVTSGIGVRRVFLASDGAELAPEAMLNTPFLAEHQPALNKLAQLRFAKAIPHRSDEAATAIRTLGWAAPEPASDLGHLRYYPEGLLAFRLIQEWQRSIISKTTQAAEIRTPMLFNWSQDMLREEAGTFQDRLYYVKGATDDRTFVLPFGGDFGTFCILRNLQLRANHLPFRVFESAASFRFEQSGEVRTFHRNRAFSFFDYHSACASEEQGWEEFASLFQAHEALARQLDLKVAVEFSITEQVFSEQKHRILKMFAGTHSHILLEILSAPKHYWCAKYVFYTAEGYRIFNAQLDFENGSRYGISYKDAAGMSVPCTLCHGSWASVERWILLNIERALSRDVPLLPLWLAPTQLRLLPVRPEHNAGAMKLAEHLASLEIRVDVDDRNRNLGLKRKRAADQWIPFVATFGDREGGDSFPVTNRELGNVEVMSGETLAARFRELRNDKPWIGPLYPLALSRRPEFASI